MNLARRPLRFPIRQDQYVGAFQVGQLERHPKDVPHAGALGYDLVLLELENTQLSKLLSILLGHHSGLFQLFANGIQLVMSRSFTTPGRCCRIRQTPECRDKKASSCFLYLLNNADLPTGLETSRVTERSNRPPAMISERAFPPRPRT